MGMCLCKDEVDETDRMILLSETFDQLVEDTLITFGTIEDNDLDFELLERAKLSERTELPESTELIERIDHLACRPMFWIALMESLVRVVHIEHPMGLNVIACLLEDFPLSTSKDVVLFLADMIADSLYRTPREKRNVSVIVGCLAEKLDWCSVDILPELVLEYLLQNLDEGIPDVMLFSLIALEKFSRQSEHQATVKRKLAMLPENPLVRLERHSNSDDFVLRQVGYCAKWCLDNYFVIEGRKYSYETVDVSNVNVMLNTKNVSEYLKISPDGLEVRCDAYSFETVRCTYQVNSGCWYFECLIITPGVLQIGWTTRDSNLLSHKGCGIGDDQYSISFDGCRRVIWHNAKAQPNDLPMWTAGSIVGCLLDIDAGEVIFSLNGIQGGASKHEFLSAGDGFFAAASFMSFQQCRFNFGSEAFRYLPKNRAFDSFNGHAILKPQDKIVLPRHLLVAEIR